MRTRPGFWIHFRIFTALAAAALAGTTAFGTAAQAADLLPQALPPLSAPAESWTGASLAVGGGVGFMTAKVKGNASRTDTFGECLDNVQDPCDFVPFDGEDATFISQFYQLNVSDLSADGIFGTIQAAYDWQVAPQWVLGVFIDADLYDLNGHAKQTSSVATDGLAFDTTGLSDDFGFSLGDATLNAKVGLDWSLTLGARFGWLARPDTLLYVLGGWTHAELQNTRFMVNITDPASPLSGNSAGLLPIDTQYLLRLSNEVDGATIGAGTEVRIGGGWSLKGEYRYTWLDGRARHASSSQVQCCTDDETGIAREIDDSASTKVDLDIHTVRGMLAYRF
jgi:outer membrane immunogenic protein